MAIQIRYFASLRDQLGRASDELPFAKGWTVASIWETLHPETPPPSNLLAAVNLEYAEWTHPVQDGDEVAFFPPVTGG